MKFFPLIVILGYTLISTTCFSQHEGGEMTIQDGKQVSIHYTLTVEGEIVDTSREREPLKYVHGQGQIIPGLSKELEGLKAGEFKTVMVSPQEGYGIFSPEAVQEVPRNQIPSDIELAPGMTLQATMSDGREQIMRIVEVKTDSVVMDLNHPLADKVLDFEIEVVSVE